MNREQTRTIAMYVGGVAILCVVVGAIGLYLHGFRVVTLPEDLGGAFIIMIVFGFFVFLGAVFYHGLTKKYPKESNHDQENHR